MIQSVVILQSDMKETVVNKSTTVFLKKCPFCKESHKQVYQNRNHLSYCTLESCKDFMKIMITNSDDQKLIYENGNIDFPAKEVCYHHNCGLKFTYQVSNQNPRMLPFSKMPTCLHIFIYLNTCHWCLNRNPLLFPSKEVSELLHKDIGNIDDISTQRTLKIQEHFCDWIKTCYYRKK